jgi:hypothetical protein
MDLIGPCLPKTTIAPDPAGPAWFVPGVFSVAKIGSRF